MKMLNIDHIISALKPVSLAEFHAHMAGAYPTGNGRITLECDGNGVPISCTKFDANGRPTEHRIAGEVVREAVA